MKIRFKAPSGGGTLDLEDAATVDQLLEALKSTTGYADVTVKYGWPPKALAPDQGSLTIQSLDLHRENLTVVPGENTSTMAPTKSSTNQGTAATRAPETVPEPAPAPAPAPALASVSAPGVASIPGLQSEFKDQAQGKGIKDQNISVFMPETNSTLVLRVMPDDNSCLFTAVGGALRGIRSGADENYTAESLRRLVVDHIQANVDKYNSVILGKSPEAYCNNMLRPDSWGGEIELSIISEVFQLEICVIDVKTNNVYRIGEGNGYEMRCVLVYSNVHYDRVAEIFVEGQEVMEFDVTRWAVDSSDHVVAHTKEMCKKLRDEHHYYTDTSDFVIMCNECGWIGQGQKALAKHSLSTGHSDISEIKDSS